MTPRSSSAPHAPAGFVAITDWPWNSLTGDGWTNTSVNGGNASILPDLTTPGTPLYVLAGFETHSLFGAGASVLEHALGTDPVNAVDAAYWFKLGAGFSHARKLNGLAPLATWIVHADDGRLITAIALDASADNSHLPLQARDGATHLLMPNLGAGTVTAAQWSRLEVLVKQSTTPTSRDGSVEWWMDNVAVGHYDSVNSAGGFTKFSIDLGGLTLPDMVSYDDTRLSIPVQPVGGIGDFSVWSTTDHSAHAVFTGIDDGAGQPARYQFRFYTDGFWETGTVAANVQCSTLTEGGVVKQSCIVNGMGARQPYALQAAAYRVNTPSDTTWGPPTEPMFAYTAPEGGAGVVTTLAVPSSGNDYIDVSFRAVADSAGTNTPARYRMHFSAAPFSWGTAPLVTTGTCAGDPPLVVDSVYTCRITGLTPGTSYGVQLNTRRVRAGQDDVFGDLSNVATGATTGTTPPP